MFGSDICSMLWYYRTGNMCMLDEALTFFSGSCCCALTFCRRCISIHAKICICIWNGEKSMRLLQIMKSTPKGQQSLLMNASDVLFFFLSLHIRTYLSCARVRTHQHFFHPRSLSLPPSVSASIQLNLNVHWNWNDNKAAVCFTFNCQIEFNFIFVQ